MGKTINNTKGIAVFCLVLVVCLTFTVLPGWIPILRKRWFLLALAFFSTAIMSTGYFKLRYMVVWYFYILVVLLNTFLGDAYFVNWIGTSYELFKWLIPPAILFFAIYNNNLKYSKAIFFCIAFIVLFEGISSLLLDLTTPGLIRNICVRFVLERDSNVFYPFYRIGMASYSFAHAVTILIPPLVYIVKDDNNKRLFRYFSVATLAFCIILCYLSGSTTALLLGVTALLLSLFSKEGSVSHNMRVLLIVLLILLPFIISDTLLFSFLNFLDRLLGGTHFHSKVQDFMDMAYYGETSGDIRARENLYMYSINLWFHHPLFGSDLMPGRHSAIFDRLASLGISGFIPLILYIYYQVKYTSVSISKNARIYYYEGFLIGFLLLLLKDSDDWETFLMLFLVMPLFLWLNDRQVFRKKPLTQ